MTTFHHIDEKGYVRSLVSSDHAIRELCVRACSFNWGLTVKGKAERVLKLLERGPFLEEERERARKIAREIKGFGSFNLNSASSRAVAQLSSGGDGSHGVAADSFYGRSNSKYEERWRRDDGEDDDDKENLIARPEPRAAREVDAEEPPHHHHPFHAFGQQRPEAMLLLSQ
ncbi:hypothetical protein EJB05_18719, partial [Eragrostis curvula]